MEYDLSFLPEYWRDIISNIIEKRDANDVKYVKIVPFASTDLFHDAVEKAKISGTEEFYTGFKFFPKIKNNPAFHSLPCSGQYIDPKEDVNEFGSYIKATHPAMLRFMNKLYDAIVQELPDMKDDFTVLFTIRGTVTTTLDNISLNTNSVRESKNLARSLSTETMIQYETFIDTLFEGIDLNELHPSCRYVKKKGTYGFGAFYKDVKNNNKDSWTDANFLVNDEDLYGNGKLEQLKYFIDHIDEIKPLIEQGDLRTLFKEHSIAFLSIIGWRKQFDEEGKIRYIIPVDNLLFYLTELEEYDYYSVISAFVKQGILESTKSPDGKHTLQCERFRTIFGQNSSVAIYANAIIKHFREFFKNKFEQTFKFTSKDILITYVLNSIGFKKFIKLLKNMDMFNLDATSFDTNYPIEGEIVLSKCISKKARFLGLLTLIISICPVAAGILGYSKKLHRKVTNMIIGLPYDPKTWFFARGKSGDTTVDFRAKFFCSFVLTLAILKTLELEFTPSNISKVLNHELPIFFLNLGDNNLIICHKKYTETLRKYIDANDILRFNYEENIKFGGMLWTIDKDHGIKIIRSPLSVIAKLVSPEYDYISKEHHGWTEGIKTRFDEAREEAEQYGDSTNLTLLELVNKLMVEELKSEPLEELADLWYENFKKVRDIKSEIYRIIYGNRLEKDEEGNLIKEITSEQIDALRETLIDPEVLAWKYSEFEFPDFIKDKLLKFTSTGLDDEHFSKLNAIWRY